MNKTLLIASLTRSALFAALVMASAYGWAALRGITKTSISPWEMGLVVFVVCAISFYLRGKDE